MVSRMKTDIKDFKHTFYDLFRRLCVDLGDDIIKVRRFVVCCRSGFSFNECSCSQTFNHLYGIVTALQIMFEQRKGMDRMFTVTLCWVV